MKIPQWPNILVINALIHYIKFEKKMYMHLFYILKKTKFQIITRQQEKNVLYRMSPD